MNYYMRDRVTVKRATSTTLNGLNEAVENFTDVFTAIPCSLQNSSRDLRIVEGGEVRRVSERAYFHAGVDVRTGDRIVSASGDTFRVVGSVPKLNLVVVAYLERLP